jgi:hypothetical protein
VESGVLSPIRLIEKLPELWAGANLEERRKLLLTMLDAVYVDAKEERRIVAIKPKAPFRPIFQVATMKEGSGIVLAHEGDHEESHRPPAGEQEADGRPCSWWRRGREPVSERRYGCRSNRGPSVSRNDSITLASQRNSLVLAIDGDTLVCGV